MIPEVLVFAQVVAISIGLIAAACGIGVATYRSVKRIDNQQLAPSADAAGDSSRSCSSRSTRSPSRSSALPKHSGSWRDSRPSAIRDRRFPCKADAWRSDHPSSDPGRCRSGDTIGVVASSYAPRSGWLARGVRALERAGYGVIVDPTSTTVRRYTRAEDERRAARFTEMWIDPRVTALIGGTGGYGAVRMLPYLDPALFAAHPKSFVGYSDITVLHIWLDAARRAARLPRTHGGRPDPERARRHDGVAAHRAHHASPDHAHGPRPRARRAPGPRVGRLVGGNLALVQQTIGTPYEIDTTDAILFLEEVRDPMSFVDERLVQLRAAGLLAKVRGIVFGHLSLDRSEEDEFEDFVLDLVSDLGVPVLMDFPAGHDSPNLTLPLGTEVELVVEETTGWIVYREDALAEASSPPPAT